jgi:hypothetical protein
MISAEQRETRDLLRAAWSWWAGRTFVSSVIDGGIKASRGEFAA